MWSVATSNRTSTANTGEATKYAVAGRSPEDCRRPNGGYMPTVWVAIAGRGRQRGGHATTCIRLENIMLSERSQAQRIS